jgi:hypothetical protein
MKCRVMTLKCIQNQYMPIRADTFGTFEDLSIQK